MPLLPVAHKPITGQARQFDGTLDAFLDIINARPKYGLSATATFDQTGGFTGLALTDGSVSLNVGDWVVFPDDLEQPAVKLTNEQALAEWEVL